MFNQAMNSCTENYECLVLDNTSKSNRIEDCVFWYKATLRKNFRIGSAEMWNYHKKHYNPKHVLEGSNGDPNKAKKKQVMSIVKKA
jgi:hypothetical protein